jgi:hypothetical protein
MKTLILFLSLAALLTVGCGSSQDDAAPDTESSSSGNPLTAPVDYLGAVGKAHQSASKTAAVVGLNQAIQLFQGEKGRMPKNLQELVPDYMPKLPAPPANMKFDYDPATGQIKVVPQ